MTTIPNVKDLIAICNTLNIKEVEIELHSGEILWPCKPGRGRVVDHWKNYVTLKISDLERNYKEIANE